MSGKGAKSGGSSSSRSEPSTGRLKGDDGKDYSTIYPAGSKEARSSSGYMEARKHWGIKEPEKDNYAEYRAIQEAFRAADRQNKSN